MKVDTQSFGMTKGVITKELNRELESIRKVFLILKQIDEDRAYRFLEKEVNKVL